MKSNVLEMTADKSTVLGAKKVRHTLSSGLSFVETAVKSISSNRPDLPQALRLHSMGIAKLHQAMIQLDHLLAAYSTSHVDD